MCPASDFGVHGQEMQEVDELARLALPRIYPNNFMDTGNMSPLGRAGSLAAGPGSLMHGQGDRRRLFAAEMPRF
jgi:hypothetical protein